LRATCGALCLAAASACTSLKSASDEVRPADPDPSENDTSEESDAASEAPSDAPDGVDTDAGMSCLDPAGFSELGCYRCAPTDTVTLENACADVSCTPFDDSLRLSMLLPDGSLPDLPPKDALAVSTSAPAAGVDALKSCADITKAGKTLYVTGSSAVQPFLAQIARQFITLGVYVIYTPTGSCIGVDAILNGTAMTTGAAPAPSTYALYWSSAVSEGERCALPAQGVGADLGISDVFAPSCPGFEIADLASKHVRDAHGPIQTMGYVVPTNSQQSEISAQAAYFVYGFGSAGRVLDAKGANAIWSDETRLLQRQASSGTQAMLAAAIGVPAARWKGKTHRTSDELVTSLLAAGGDLGTANQTLGILAVDYLDSKNLRAQVRVLAFRDTHQTCAVYPDSTETARDRRNVRDGHYPLWGPMHLFHQVNDDGLPAKVETRQEVSDALGYLAGTKALPNGVKLIDLYADSGLVPECAMRVTRNMDGGEITPKRPDSACSCLYEARARGVSPCAPCKVQGDCKRGETCSFGYCES
jgi:ABC-type phosphate transport system substrate-binding protein